MALFRSYFVLSVCTLVYLSGTTQTALWQSFTDSIPTLSSPRGSDLNGDGVIDIVIGGGTDGVFSNNGIMAYNGASGELLWKRSARNEIFTSAAFQDINGDGTDDVFIGGRQAQLYAINGANGQLIWEYYPYTTDPSIDGLYNFYTSQFIPDQDGDLLPDLLVANGGDHSLPDWETDRPPGHIMVISSATGALLAMAVVPDNAETYCSPVVVDLQGDGNLWVLFGTGGETLGGSFWAAPLSSVLNEDISGSVALATHPTRGFIAPPSLHKKSGSNAHDVIVQAFGGQIYKIDGQTLSQVWSQQLSNTQSSSAPVIGNFTGDMTPDVYVVLYKGQAPSYSDFYQVMLNGTDGSIEFMDSIGNIHFASGNAVDINNDGRDEAIASVNYFEAGCFRNKLQAIDFQNNMITQIGSTKAGVNIGSTPFISDLDNDNLIDIVYVVKKDSIDPMGWKGIFLNRIELTQNIPNSGIAWGAYIANNSDGVYDYLPVNCGSGSVIASSSVVNPNCNDSATGYIIPNLIPGGEPHTFLWSDGSVGSTLNNLTAGTYSLTVTDASGCFEEIYYTLSDPFLISFGGVQGESCPGKNDGKAIVSSSGCYCMFSTCQFLWENGVATSSNTTLEPGYNSVLITHSNGCLVQDSVFIPEAAPIWLDTTVFDVACFNENSGSILLEINPDLTYTYAWSNGESTEDLENIPSGEYTLIIEDNRPCRDTLIFTVFQPELLTLTTTSSDITCFGDNDGTVQVSTTGGTPQYLYYIDGQFDNSGIYENLPAGEHSFYVEDQNGCTTAVQTVNILEPAELTISLTATPESGPGSLDGIAECTTSGGTEPYTISWNDPNNQTGPMAVYLTNGWVTATVTDANGCSQEESIFIGTTSTNTTVPSEIAIYPNPANDLLFVDSNEPTETIISDMNGKLILKSTAHKIDLQEISSGVYELIAIHSKGLIRTRLVIQR
jgi:hypothetical protein